MRPTLIAGIILLVGFLCGEMATRLRLPKVTGYIFAGILLNPRFLGLIPKDFTQHTDFITNFSLSFITFCVGGTLLYPQVRKLGKGILYITVCEAEFAFIIVAFGFLATAPLFLRSGEASWLTTFIPLSLLMASLASPTDPSATLAVAHEYKARGSVSSTIMGVAAFDDILGIVNYSVVVIVASVLISHKAFSIATQLVQILMIIGGAIFLGTVFGFLFNAITLFIKREKEGVLIVVILGLLSLCFGAAKLVGVEELLATMTMGIIVVNFNPQRHKIFKMLERYTEELIFVLFFTTSGMQLNFGVLASSFLIVLLFAVFRAIGKVAGTMIGASLAKSSLKVRRYTAGGLIPQGGIVVGLALMMKQNPSFGHISDIIVSTIIGATVLHELTGPIVARAALKRAGEIRE